MNNYFISCTYFTVSILIDNDCKIINFIVIGISIDGDFCHLYQKGIVYILSSTKISFFENLKIKNCPIFHLWFANFEPITIRYYTAKAVPKIEVEKSNFNDRADNLIHGFRQLLENIQEQTGLELSRKNRHGFYKHGYNFDFCIGQKCHL